MSLASACSAAVKPGPSNEVRLRTTQSSAVNWTNNPRSRTTAAVTLLDGMVGTGLLKPASRDLIQRTRSAEEALAVLAAASGHGARYLAAGNVTFGEAVASDGAAPDHGVDAADADRLGGDQHLPVRGARVREVDDGQAFWTSEGLDLNCLHCRLLVLGSIVLGSKLRIEAAPASRPM
jgi:hypothetical protein